jgi:predicted outer membrane protein
MSDEQIAGFTEAVNAGELEQAKLATLTSKRSEVKKLAAMLIAHHGDALQKQAKLALKTADSPATSQLGVDAADARKKLDGSSGADFDRVFVAAQVDVHRKVLSVLLSQLLPNARNPALRAYIEELKPKLEQHLESAEQLQKEFPPLLVTTSAAPTKSAK